MIDHLRKVMLADGSEKLQATIALGLAKLMLSKMVIDDEVQFPLLRPRFAPLIVSL